MKEGNDHGVGAIECACFQNVKLWFISSAFAGGAQNIFLPSSMQSSKGVRQVTVGMPELRLLAVTGIDSWACVQQKETTSSHGRNSLQNISTGLWIFGNK